MAPWRTSPSDDPAGLALDEKPIAIRRCFLDNGCFINPISISTNIVIRRCINRELVTKQIFFFLEMLNMQQWSAHLGNELVPCMHVF